jgi:putative ABC transport system permease protein
MLLNYLKTAFRNLVRYKGYSFINILGLTVGLATAIFIFLWVADEVSYDKFHKNADRAFRVMRHATFNDGRIVTRSSAPEPLAEAMQHEVPEIEYMLRLTWNMKLLVRSGDEAFYENGFYADSTIFNMFTFPVIQGNAADPLPDISSIAISEKLAEKYFKGESPLGKTLQVDQRSDFKVSAVFANVPENSELRFDYIIPFEVWRKENNWTEGWGNTGMQMLASLRPGADLQAVNKKISGIIRKNCDDCTSTPFLFPYTKLRLYGEFENGQNTGGRIDYVLSLSLVAVIVLVIACINFMNLATARAATRSREVGVRKAIGAKRSGLIIQFVSESFLLTFIALMLSLVLVQLFLPFFNSLADKSIRLDFTDPLFLSGLLIVSAFSGLLSGIYPAFFLSSFKPASVLKGTTPLSGGRFRKMLVVVQFVASVILIIVSVIVYNQIAFIQNTHLGFDKENILMIDQVQGVFKNQQAFKNDLLQNPQIRKVSFGGHHPFNVQHRTDDPSWPGKPEGGDISFNVIQCDHDFIPVMDMTVLEGKNFTGIATQDSSNFIVNEQAMEAMGFTRDNIIGTPFTLWGVSGRITGLVKDFNNTNLHEAIAPQIFVCNLKKTWRVYVKADNDNWTKTIAYIKQTQLKYDPDFPFQYSFLDQEFAREYRSEEVIGKLSRSFTVVALLISCLGLFGLASFTAERRMKELGIRKVLGASAARLIIMLCSDFARLVFISLVIGIPVAWFLGVEYLAGYTFHYVLSPWIFVGISILIMSIALLTVVYQAARAALANPVDSLRNE